MAYAAQSDLVPNRMSAVDLAQLTDDSGANPPVIQADVVTAALNEASGKIDSYCRGRYLTPLQECADVTALCTDIAAYILFSRRRALKEDDIIARRNDQAIKMLEGIAKGTINLDLPMCATPQTPVVGPQVACVGEVFGDRNLEGFVGGGGRRRFRGGW